MTRLTMLACVFAVLLVSSPTAVRAEATAQSAGGGPSADLLDTHRGLVTTYCATCHSETAKLGGLALQGMDLEAVVDDAKIWEKAIRKLRGRLMPPPGSPQPEQAAIDSFVGWLESTLDTPTGTEVGHVPIHRLNRTEYVAAVRDLLSVEVEPDILPQDITVDGFDNIAAALSVSPAFVEQYVSAARSIAQKAVGGPILEVLKYTLDENQDPEGMPLGLRTGLMFKHNFQADGEYRFNVLFPDQTVGLYTGSLENANTLVIMIDGKVMFRDSIGGLNDLMLNHRLAGDGRAEILERFSKVPVQVQAGVRDVVVGFIERSQFESTANTGGGGRGGGNQPRLGDVEIAGPYDSTGVSSPSRELIYVCDPVATGEAACARQITENLATRAFRRPATEEDVTRLLQLYEIGRSEGGNFDQGMVRLITAVLASPEFLYRTIRSPENSQAVLSDLELASRLSFFIWNTGPDAELLDLAVANRLSEPVTLDAQVERMLADPKASSLVSSFAIKWLRLNDLESVVPDETVFPGFDDALYQDFSTEVELFIGSILLEDRNVFDLLTADHTFLNDRLASHYGIEGVRGSQFRKFMLSDEVRFGLLGKAAVLLSTSYGDRTSPVLRGAWVLERLLGTPPSPPPPNVEAFPENVEGERARTVRARLEQHRASPTCNQCHGVIDPIGLALENFDAIGEWRTTDRAAEATIDARTIMPNGEAIDGPVELREQLVANPAMFAQVVTEKLLMYSLGRELEYFDMPQVRAVVRNAANENFKWSSIVKGIVHTDAFRMQGAPH